MTFSHASPKDCAEASGSDALASDFLTSASTNSTYELVWTDEFIFQLSAFAA